jgi:hypothetical protein
MIHTFETMHGIFDRYVVSSAFLDLQGRILSTRSSSAAFLISPVQAARFAIAYFPLQDGDWMAVNDAHIGGVTPHGLNFLGRMNNLIWSVRFENTLPWNLSEKWEHVGFKIPPLPIKIAGQLNQQIPQNFLELVQSNLTQLDPLIQRLQRFCTWRASELTTPKIEHYFQQSQAALKSILKETPWVDAQHKARTSSGEILNAKIQFQEKMCAIDLSGSSLSLQIQVCEKVVDSILIYSLNKSLNSLSFYNHGTESFFQVLKPRQSWLSHNEPKFPAHSSLLGIPFIESHIKQMLLKMKRPVENWNCSKEGWFQVVDLSSKQFITTDQMKNCWGQSCSFIQAEAPIESGLSFKTLSECELLMVQSGQLVTTKLKPQQTFEFKIN